MVKNKLNEKRLLEEIELTHLNSDGYLDAIISVCEKHGFEIEDIAAILNPIIKKKLEVECINKGLVDGIKVNSLEDF